MDEKHHHTTTGLDNPGFEPTSRRISQTSFDTNPVIERKKSILHISRSASFENMHKHDMENGRSHNFHMAARKKSAFSLSSSIRDKVEYTDELERSWLYLFCTRCHGRAEADSWEPTGWRRACPQPFCPTYRKFARVLCLLLLGLLLWGVVYSIIGEDAAPGGPLFGLACLSIAAHFAGWLVTLANMPALIGMLLTGIILQNTGLVSIEGSYARVVADLRKIALVIILTRAGLDLDPEAMKSMKITVPKVGLLPWLVEALVVSVGTHYLMGLPWIWGFLLGSIIAAVSPAVVVPCLFRLRSKGYGVAKGIPTLIIAVAGIDDAASVAIYGIIHSVMFSNDALWYQILQGPIAIVGGIGFGVIWGALSRYVPEKGDPFMVPMRVLMLLGGGLLAVFGSELINLGGAGPLAVVAAAFVSCYLWQKDGWEPDDNPVATSFEIFWMIFEPILFGVTGTQIKLGELNGNTVYIGIGCLLAGIVIRILVTVLVGIGSRLNLKEKIFIALACMAKATVQAALGPATLDKLDPNDTEQRGHGEIVLMLCVLSILLTAPTGAIVIMLSGPKLLTKTRAPVAPTGHNSSWRTRRPSIRDISIINEMPDLEETTLPSSETAANSNSSLSNLGNNLVHHNNLSHVLNHDNNHR
ncbi:sodium/hydrogen exchanger 9B2 [Nasonia vitripennis]|uniref:Cation/H+ exchanger transmembrane domain-containing protein n=1 Tax=Nasonia vitripennis TaxID=7425 RepID=A0A7M7GD18_NASVI|nr:sodium/hydrogen exchanger 9B2 [Nasonia vitripennis]